MAGEKSINYTHDLTINLLNGLENKGFILFCDSWYSSVSLFQDLSEMGIAATGMIRSDRSKVFKKFLNEMGESECKFAYQKNVNAIQWKEKKQTKRKSNKTRKSRTVKKSIKFKTRLLSMISAIHTNELTASENQKGKKNNIPCMLANYRKKYEGC